MSELGKALCQNDGSVQMLQCLIKEMARSIVETENQLKEAKCGLAKLVGYLEGSRAAELWNERKVI